MHHTTSRRDRGFTLIELMVVIAIIALLVTLVAVSLKTVRGSARRTVSLSALKQIMMAYSSYSDDNRGQLLPGYIDSDLFADGQPFGNLRVTLPDGTVLDQCVGSICDASSYVWRLAPYVDNAWEVFYTELRDEGLMAQLHAEYTCGIYGPGTAGTVPCPEVPAPIGNSERPTYGLNSIFVGGDSVHGGTDVTDRHPWTGDPNVVPLAATRFTQVKNPARLIVFGAAAKANPDAPNPVYLDESFGFCELRPPFLDESSGAWIDPQWIIGAGGMIEDASTDQFGTGIPIDRHGKGIVPVAHLDGSATAVSLADLAADMRMWNPRGVGPLGLTPGN